MSRENTQSLLNNSTIQYSEHITMSSYICSVCIANRTDARQLLTAVAITTTKYL